MKTITQKLIMSVRGVLIRWGLLPLDLMPERTHVGRCFFIFIVWTFAIFLLLLSVVIEIPALSPSFIRRNCVLLLDTDSDLRHGSVTPTTMMRLDLFLRLPCPPSLASAVVLAASVVLDAKPSCDNDKEEELDVVLVIIV